MAIAEDIRFAADGKDASVLSVEKTRKTTAPPKLYDLTLLQRDANRLLGYTAQQTLDFLQSDYEKKLCTYPRVDSNYLTDDIGGTAATVIGAVKGMFSFGETVSFSPDIARVTNNSKVSDHHAIIPTIGLGKADLAALPAGERDILTLIAALAHSPARRNSAQVQLVPRRRGALPRYGEFYGVAYDAYQQRH